jgi:hypothetical protein
VDGVDVVLLLRDGLLSSLADLEWRKKYLVNSRREGNPTTNLKSLMSSKGAFLYNPRSNPCRDFGKWHPCFDVTLECRCDWIRPQMSNLSSIIDDMRTSNLHNAGSRTSLS